MAYLFMALLCCDFYHCYCSNSKQRCYADINFYLFISLFSRTDEGCAVSRIISNEKIRKIKIELKVERKLKLQTPLIRQIKVNQNAVRTYVADIFVSCHIKIIRPRLSLKCRKEGDLPVELLGDPEVTANLYCHFAYPYWEGCVICSIYLR